MSRAAITQSKLLIGAFCAAAIVGGAGVWGVLAYATSHEVHTVTNAAHQITQIEYRGQNGADALTLLRTHADVQVKQYTFGDMVVAIDGSVGNGPKYWTFYINGKEANVGAGAYKTKSSDMLMWRLQ